MGAGAACTKYRGIHTKHYNHAMRLLVYALLVGAASTATANDCNAATNGQEWWTDNIKFKCEYSESGGHTEWKTTPLCESDSYTAKPRNPFRLPSTNSSNAT